MATAPLYAIGDRVYLRESAGLGYLEAVYITGIATNNAGQWIYSYSAKPRDVLSQTYGDRRSLVNGYTLYLTDYDVVDLCTALQLAIQSVQANLATLQNMQQTYCQP